MEGPAYPYGSTRVWTELSASNHLNFCRHQHQPEPRRSTLNSRLRSSARQGAPFLPSTSPERLLLWKQNQWPFMPARTPCGFCSQDSAAIDGQDHSTVDLHDQHHQPSTSSRPWSRTWAYKCRGGCSRSGDQDGHPRRAAECHFLSLPFRSPSSNFPSV